MSEQTAAPVAEEAPKAKDMHLPPMHRISNDLLAPTAPQDVASARIDEDSLGDLVIKQAYTVARFSTEWIAKELHLSLPLVKQLMEQLCLEGNLEGMMGNRFAITDRGREQARRLLEVCGYIGPAPVRLEAYSAMLRWQFKNRRSSRQKLSPRHSPSSFSIRKQRSWPVWPFPPAAACSFTARRATARAASAGRFTAHSRATSGFRTPSPSARA